MAEIWYLTDLQWVTRMIVGPAQCKHVELRKVVPDASEKAGPAVGELKTPEEFGGRGLTVAVAECIQVCEQLGLGAGAYAFAASMHNICTFSECAQP